MLAQEGSLIRTVGTLAVAADAARLGTVSRVNQRHGHTYASRLVLRKLPQLEESPVSQSSPKTLASRLLAPVANAGEILQRDSGAECLRLFDKTFADVVIDPRLVSSLPTGHFLQSAFRGLCSSPLVLLSRSRSPSALPLNLIARERLTSRVGCDVDDAKIDAKEGVNSKRWGSFLLDLNVQEVPTIAAYESRGSRHAAGQRFPLKCSETGSDSVSTVEQRQAKGPVGFTEGGDAGIVVDTGRAKERAGGCRRDSCNGTNSQVGGKSESLANVPVAQLLQSESPPGIRSDGLGSDVIASGGERSNGCVDLYSLFGCGIEFTTDGSERLHLDHIVIALVVHTGILCFGDIYYKPGRRRCLHSSPRLKPGLPGGFR